MQNLFQEFIFKRTYAKFIEQENRREEWHETVDRYINYVFDETVPDSVMIYKEECRESIMKMEIMPSMRMMLTSGKCHAENHVSGYNCAFVAVDDPKVFSEIMFMLMSGTGCGFSVEKKYVDQLPTIPEHIMNTTDVFVVDDSKIGWAEALQTHIQMLYSGNIYNFDYSKIRKQGERLKTMGGYSSGSQALQIVMDFATQLFLNAVGRKLSSLECHSLLCKVGSVVVVGGTRRSAMISFSDLDDDEMAKAKSGDWYSPEVGNLHFSLANNSAVYTVKPSMEEYLKETYNIYKSYSGERGMYNLEGVKKHLPERRKNANNIEEEYYSNPCSEISLRSSGQMCNLTEVIIKTYDTEESIKSKIRIASILGTLQARYTDFKFLRPIYKNNCEDEALLGVSMTGIYDNIITREPKPEFLCRLRETAISVNQKVASDLGINPSTAITAIKPSGSVSALCGTGGSGIHPAFSKYYIRRVRVSKTDPISDIMKHSNVPYETDFYSKDNYVFSFPIQSPEGSVTIDDVTAVEHLKLYYAYTEFYTEHKVSITISYKPEEYFDLCKEIYNNWDLMLGVALLPKSDSTYQQMPFQKITKEQYEEAESKMPKEIDWSLFQKYENKKNFIDSTDTQVCVGVGCEL